MRRLPGYHKRKIERDELEEPAPDIDHERLAIMEAEAVNCVKPEGER